MNILFADYHGYSNAEDRDCFWYHSPVSQVCSNTKEDIKEQFSLSYAQLAFFYNQIRMFKLHYP
jgi:hypothetical protein